MSLPKEDFVYSLGPAPEGAVQCLGCGWGIPVLKNEEGQFKVIPHPSRSGKSMCLAGGAEVHESHVKRAVWIDGVS